MLKAFPFDSVDTTETEYSLLFQQLQDDGLAGVPGSTAGQVTAGSGMQINVAPFPLAILAGFALYSDAVTQLTPAAGGSQPRIDRIVLRVDPTANLPEIAVKAGTPAVTPSVPALTQSLGGVWEIPLARIAVGTNAVNVVAGNITDERKFVGTRVGGWTTATRPSVKGRVGFNFTTGKLEFHDGGGMVTVNDWNELVNKPATYPPSAHTHTSIDNVDGDRVFISPAGYMQHVVDGTAVVEFNPSGQMTLGSIPVGNGGTGATSASGARAALGAAATSHTHPWGDITGEPATYPPSAHDINTSHTGTLQASRVVNGAFLLSEWITLVDNYMDAH